MATSRRLAGFARLSKKRGSLKLTEFTKGGKPTKGSPMNIKAQK